MKIKQSNEHKVFRKVYIKYLIIRVRAKISFMALIQRKTIVELFATTIEKCYYDLQEEGYIKKLTANQL